MYQIYYVSNYFHWQFQFIYLGYGLTSSPCLLLPVPISKSLSMPLLRAPDLKKVIGGHLRSKKNAMCDLRLKLQTLVDTVNVIWLVALVWGVHGVAIGWVMQRMDNMIVWYTFLTLIAVTWHRENLHQFPENEMLIVNIWGTTCESLCVFCLVAQETGLLALVEQATKLIEEYTNFLSRSNMK